MKSNVEEDNLEYDLLYQAWLTARRAKDYVKADRLRERFERLHKLTIFAEGDMPDIGVTVRRMEEYKWQMKYGDPEVGKLMRERESKVDKFVAELKRFGGWVGYLDHLRKTKR